MSTTRHHHLDHHHRRHPYSTTSTTTKVRRRPDSTGGAPALEEMTSSPDDPPLPPWSEGDKHDDRQLRYKHLDCVCERRRAARLHRLLTSGWDVNECFYTSPWAEECQHALNMAVWHGWEEGVKVLLDAGANTHKTGGDCGCSPAPVIPDAVINFCNLATEMRRFPNRQPDKSCEVESSLNIVRMLIKHGCDVNRAGDDGLPVLQIAARCQDVRVLRLLLSAGARANLQNDRASAKGRSALTKAVDVNNKPAVKLLLQYGADVNIRCQVVSGMPGRRVTFQGLVARSLDLQHFDVTELLVRAGCTVNLQDREKLDSLALMATTSDKDDTQNDGWETEEEEEIVGLTNAGDYVIANAEEEDSDDNHTNNMENSNVPVMASSRRRFSTRDRQVAELFRLMQLFTRPLPLKDQCRRYLRQEVGFHTPDRVKTLSIPRVLKEYLLCRDL